MHCGGVGVVLVGLGNAQNGVLFVFLSFFLVIELNDETTNAGRVEVASEGKGITLVFWLLRLHACFLGASAAWSCVWVGPYQYIHVPVP